MRVWNEVEDTERLCLHNMNNQKFLARVKYFAGLSHGQARQL